ncbi:ATP-binding cassette subfamily B protein RaxB [Caulobacter ginsengisoli]|uniref:ATP-binding cassette subfamily B protein RaxB n=1 Tax=Caulobacter ginsengisoli TaxID=400775 RepID=A0ABU0IW38_9CAUL|nr:peptidase domain-containing ABC transporter [Caulobacter ginsengisoli]MDQ0466223.1 ATP-binding cassette subfamily B protein RaxB [Caulobacter ginsengisoli]
MTARPARVPSVLQISSTECGIACLAMVAEYHGAPINYGGLRERYPVSARGMNLRRMMQVADELQLSARPLRVALAGLSQVLLPAILHWDFDHFVVLERVGRASVTIQDPRSGRAEIALDEFSNHFTGVVLELSPRNSFASGAVLKRSRLALSTLLSGYRGHLNGNLQNICLAALAQVIILSLPLVIQLIVDQVLPNYDLGLLTWLCLVFLALSVLATASDLIRSLMLSAFGAELSFFLSSKAMGKVFRLPIPWFERRQVGDALTRLNSVRDVQSFITVDVAAMTLDGVSVAALVMVMLVYSPRLTMIVVASFLFYAAVLLVALPILRRLQEQSIAAGGEEHGHVVETLRSMRSLKAFGQEAVREGQWRNLLARSLNASVKVTRMRAAIAAIQSVLFNAQGAVIIFLAVTAFLNGTGMTVGMLLSFLFYRQAATDRASSLFRGLTNFRMLELYLDRLSDIVMAKSDENTGLGDGEIDGVGSIEFSGVSYRYGDGEVLRIVNATFQIEKGSLVAFAGPTGGGKSTLVKLLLGLYRPTAGQICIDGRAIDEIGWNEWRRHVGTVLQDDTLFAGSVADNISFFDPHVDLERVREAATMAEIAADIDGMPMKYWTWLGDMGSTLSGGQRQRVLLARALYVRPEVLVLDEGTANLDEQTERAVLATISKLPITRIVVTHRPQTLATADRILWVDRGIVSERA